MGNTIYIQAGTGGEKRFLERNHDILWWVQTIFILVVLLWSKVAEVLEMDCFDLAGSQKMKMNLANVIDDGYVECGLDNVY